MAIKNSSSSLIKISLAVILFSGCSTFQRPRHPTQPPPVSVEPGQARPAEQIPLSPNAAPPAPGAPLTSQALPVGVFLGPGAMRSFAHVGVLRALQRAQLPIVAIGGMEWGSVVAASFALSHGANEVEWEMLKLKKDQLPSTTLLKRDLTANDPGQLFDFLKIAFGDKDLSQGSIPFRCPTTDGQETVFISNGKAREQLLKCAVLPPLYNFYDRAGKQWVSGAVSPGDWPGELRKLGAQVIVYVEVLTNGKLLDAGKYNDPSLKALWLAIRGISKQQHLFANFTIDVPTDIEVADFEKRREAISSGEQAAQNSIPAIMSAVGLH